MRGKKQKNIEIAHLFSSSFRKESGVQRMTVVCRHTYDPCSCAQRNMWGMCEADTVPTGQTCCTRVTLGDGRTQEMIHSYGKTFPLSPRHTHTCTHTQTGHCFDNSPADQRPVTFPLHRSSKKTGVQPDGLACQTYAAHLKAQAPVSTVFWTWNDFAYVVTKLKFQNKIPQFGPIPVEKIALP